MNLRGRTKTALCVRKWPKPSQCGTKVQPTDVRLAIIPRGNPHSFYLTKQDVQWRRARRPDSESKDGLSHLRVEPKSSRLKRGWLKVQRTHHMHIKKKKFNQHVRLYIYTTEHGSVRSASTKFPQDFPLIWIISARTARDLVKSWWNSDSSDDVCEAIPDPIRKLFNQAVTYVLIPSGQYQLNAIRANEFFILRYVVEVFNITSSSWCTYTRNTLILMRGVYITAKWCIPAPPWGLLPKLFQTFLRKE